MVRVIWTPAALDDLNDIKDFIAGWFKNLPKEG